MPPPQDLLWPNPHCSSDGLLIYCGMDYILFIYLLLGHFKRLLKAFLFLFHVFFIYFKHVKCFVCYLQVNVLTSMF